MLDDFIFPAKEKDEPTADDYYEQDDLDFAYLDSYVGDDAWYIRFEDAGAIEYDPDWL